MDLGSEMGRRFRDIRMDMIFTEAKTVTDVFAARRITECKIALIGAELSLRDAEVTQLDPVGCGCTGCITNLYRPFEGASDVLVLRMLAEEIDNRTGIPLAQMTYELQLDDVGRIESFELTSPDRSELLSIHVRQDGRGW